MNADDNIAGRSRTEGLAAASTAAWLWDCDEGRMLEGNAAALKLWRVRTSERLRAIAFDAAMPAAAVLRAAAGHRTAEQHRLVFWSDRGVIDVVCRCLAAGRDGLVRLDVVPPSPADAAGPELTAAAGEAVACDRSPVRSAPAITATDAATLAEIARLIRGQEPAEPEVGALDATGPSEAPVTDGDPGAWRTVEMLATVSHELRTPLSAIIGFADLMYAEMLGPIGNPRYREYAHDIGEGARHALSLVDDLLNSTRYQAAGALAAATVDAGATVDWVAGLLRALAEEGGVALTVAIGPAPPDVRCDPRSLRQILLNLASNAIRHTPRGGSVRIEVLAQAGIVEIAVEDSGVGIEEPAEGNAVRGLGLPLSRMLAAANGGELRLAPRQGGGTRASVRLRATAP